MNSTTKREGGGGGGGQLRIQKKKCALYTYGFHEEFLRRRSKVRNKFIRNLSSTSPSSNIALHSGPRRESCNTLIGVIAKSSGTTNRTPEIIFKNNFFYSKSPSMDGYGKELKETVPLVNAYPGV